MDARQLEQVEHELDARQRRAKQALALACMAALAAIPALWISPRLSIALAVGGALEGAIAGALFLARREKIAQLALDPRAHAIPDVGRYGRRCVREREWLAGWLREVVADARRPGALYLPDRVEHFANDIERLASDLASSAAKVQPAAAVACRRLLTHAAESPLYNPRVPPDELRTALLRIRSGIQAS